MLKYGCSKNGREKKYIERTKKHTNIFFSIKVSQNFGVNEKQILRFCFCTTRLKISTILIFIKKN